LFVKSDNTIGVVRKRRTLFRINKLHKNAEGRRLLGKYYAA